MELIDLDGDGDMEILAQVGMVDNIAEGQPYVFIIDPKGGTIIARWDDTTLSSFHSDLNGNGIPEITIMQNDGVVCMVELIDGLVLRIDPFDNYFIYPFAYMGFPTNIVDLDLDGKDDLILMKMDPGSFSQYLVSTDHPDGICISESFNQLGRYHISVVDGKLSTVFTAGDVLQGFSIPLGEIPSDVREIEVQTITFTEERYIGRTYFEDDDDASDDDLMDPTDTDDDDVPDSLISDQQDAIDISPILTFSIITFAMMVTFAFVVNKWRKY